jgi:hypothetical protein
MPSDHKEIDIVEVVGENKWTLHSKNG